MKSDSKLLDPSQGLNGGMRGLKVGIVGSREYPNEDQVKLLVSLLPDDAEVVSGGQSLGVDGWAKKYALQYGLKYTEFAPAHYHGAPYDVNNYFIRNRQIAEYCDVVFVFMYNHSKGAASIINYCEELRTPDVIVKPYTDVYAVVHENISEVENMIKERGFSKVEPVDDSPLVLVCPFCGRTEETVVYLNTEGYPLFSPRKCPGCGAEFFYDHAPVTTELQEKLECIEARNISGFWHTHGLHPLYPIALRGKPQ